jgi:hypothetical protein
MYRNHLVIVMMCGEATGSILVRKLVGAHFKIDRNHLVIVMMCGEATGSTLVRKVRNGILPGLEMTT